MNAHYSDILDLTDRPPIWFDEHAVPRFVAFEPGLQANIYADEVALVEIRCQSCSQVFHVCFSAGLGHSGEIGADIKTADLHYGDPPNIECCMSGPSMNSEPSRVLEYWSHNHDEFTGEGPKLPGLRVVTDIRAYMEWRRDPSLEIDITPDWVKESR